MEYTNRHSRRSKVYIIVGVIVALMVGGSVFLALQFSGITQETPVEMREVVVAVAEIPARKTIEEADLQLRTLPADPTNASAFTALEEVVGRIASIPIPAGQILAPNLLASTVSGQEYSIIEPGEEFDPEGPDVRAVSLTVADDRAVAGTLQPGHRVDLIVTLQVAPPPVGDGETTEFVGGPSTKVTLQTITILARAGGLYILRTDLPTAEKIAELQAAGAQFAFALRAEPDDRTAETEGSTLDMLLDEFEFPVPRAGDLGVTTPEPNTSEPTDPVEAGSEEDADAGTGNDGADDAGETP